MDSSEKAKGKEKVETMEVSETIRSVGGEGNPSAAGGLSPGDIGAYASRMDEATDVWAKKMLEKIRVVLQKPHNYTASKSTSTAPASTEDRDKMLYEPRAVAIGPYHRKTEGNYFTITDEHKLWCVRQVIGDNYKRDLSEEAKGKEKVETTEASETISPVEGEDNSSAAGGLSPGDIGAYASPRDEATDDRAKKMLQYEIDVVLQKPIRAVAIGPYHRKTEDNYFRITDEHKLWCVKEVIGDNYKRDLGKFLGKMKERKERAVKFYRERYGEDYNFGMDSQSFLEMLMLDSCFILFALSFNYGLAKVVPILFGLGDITWAQRDIVRASELVKTDLLLLNNQIPFFILEDVFKMKNEGNEGNGSIRKDASQFFYALGLGGNSSNVTEPTDQVHHLLHLYHMHLNPTEHRSPSLRRVIDLLIDRQRSLPSATKLQRKSAVNFKVKKRAGLLGAPSVLDVTTSKSGDIEMPVLRVEDHTNILLHNLISFEKSSGITNSYITAYVAFLDHIVRREEDVELLETSEVLEHRLSSPAEVVALFRQLHNVIDHSKMPGYLAKLYQEVNRCCDSKWRRMYADVKGSSVWLKISFVTGITVSVATLIETMYAIIGYYKK